MTDVSYRDTKLLADIDGAVTNLVIVLGRLPAGDASDHAKAYLDQSQRFARQAIAERIADAKAARRRPPTG